MFFFINILFLFFFILFTKYYFKSKHNFSYNKITKIYLSLLCILILLSAKFNYLDFNQSFNYLCLIMNLMLFISFILTIGLKYVNSPSYYIIKFLKKNNLVERKKILLYLKEKNIIESRINILKNEKLIEIQNNSIFLTNHGKIFCKFFLHVKKIFGIKSEG